jgi:hypothetical protein
MGFVICLVGACAGVLYCLMFVTQPMKDQAPNDVVLFEILKTVLVSMISIIGTLMAVGHGSNASALPNSTSTPPVTSVKPLAPAPQTAWVNRPAPPPVKSAASVPNVVRPLSTSKPVDDDDEPAFKGAKE